MAYVKYKIGSIITNNQGSRFKILEITDDKRYVVESLDTGYKTNISRSAMYSGKYLDKLLPRVN